MYASLWAIAAAVACVAAQTTPSLPSVTAAAGSLGLGAVCSTSEQCANGADCYGVTAFTIKTCGSFQSSCSSDSQCATNTCNNGLCNGFLATSLYQITRTSASSTAAPTQPSPSLPAVTAAAGTLGLGAVCSSSEQCANGADCYGVTAFTIKTCGSFQSSCTSDSQCATNNCNNGFCNGFLDPSAYRKSTTTTATSISSSQVVSPTLPTITAAPRSLGLGATCSNDGQCPVGVQCYGTTAFTIKRCGAFNAACQNDDQCSTNTCSNGLCSGFLASSLYKLPSATLQSTTLSPVLSTLVLSTTTAGLVGNATLVVPSTPTASTSPLFTGGASQIGMGSGVIMAVLVIAGAL
jgi:hypothetical protein